MFCFIRRAAILLLILALIGWVLPRDVFASGFENSFVHDICDWSQTPATKD